MTWGNLQTQGQASVSATYAFANNVVGNSLLVAAIECDGADGLDMGVPTDSMGNRWDLIGQFITTNTQKLGWWWAVAKQSGACTVTWGANTNNTFAASKLTEWSNDGVGSPVVDGSDLSYQGITGPSSDNFVSSDGVTHYDDGLVLGLMGTDDNGGAVIQAGTNFTMLNNTGVLGTSDSFAMNYKIIASAGGVIQGVFTVLNVSTSGGILSAGFGMIPEHQTYYHRRSIMVQR